MVRANRPLSQAEIEDGCARARDRYIALPPKVAGEFFAFELQGFIAAEVASGLSFTDAVVRVVDLLGMLIRANAKDTPPGDAAT